MVGAAPAPELAAMAEAEGGSGRIAPLDLDALAESWRARMQRLRDATERPREPLALLGYEVSDLEAFVMAGRSSRGIAEAGESVAAFDRRNQREPLCVLAGGGRGIELVSRARTGERQAELAREFAERSGGGALVSACVPYEPAQERECLRWLALALGDAFETSPRPDGARGTAAGEEASVSELGEGGRVVAICAGENLRRLLASFETLETLSGMSALVFAILAHAQRSAERGLRTGKESGRARSAAPANGGAALRALVAPSHALRYAADLVRSVQSLASDAVRIAGGFPEAAAHQLSRCGLSVGLFVSTQRAPAIWMIERARAAESLASDACAARGWRSALYVERASAADAWRSAAGELLRDSRPYSLEATAWQSWLRRASALRRVPAAERAHARGRGASDEAFWNHFQYQVARSPAWKRYFRICGADWREPETLRSARPDRALEILAELVA